mmetsp:Transcript_66548/g.144531  ORF Transcript_66548/g.144531 Transcript_66548/m.144531 type:complete len:219 (-) Transcript_66548:995-1651(-)
MRGRFVENVVLVDLGLSLLLVSGRLCISQCGFLLRLIPSNVVLGDQADVMVRLFEWDVDSVKDLPLREVNLEDGELRLGQSCKERQSVRRARSEVAATQHRRSHSPVDRLADQLFLVNRQTHFRFRPREVAKCLEQLRPNIGPLAEEEIEGLPFDLLLFVEERRAQYHELRVWARNDAGEVLEVQLCFDCWSDWAKTFLGTIAASMFENPMTPAVRQE